jgi:hypothetical protein
MPEERGQRYGRRPLPINIKDERGIRKEENPEGGGEMTEMMGRNRDAGYGGDRRDRFEGGGGGNYR